MAVCKACGTGEKAVAGSAKCSKCDAGESGTGVGGTCEACATGQYRTSIMAAWPVDLVMQKDKQFQAHARLAQKDGSKKNLVCLSAANVVPVFINQLQRKHIGKCNNIRLVL